MEPQAVGPREVDADAIVRRVSSAFADDAARPPALTLHGADAVDSYAHPAPFDAARDEPTDAYLETYAFWGIAHLDAASWRHYLPRLVAYAFRRPDDPRMVVEATVASLRPPDRDPPRLAALRPEQEAALTAFLEALAFHGASPEQREEARQALEEWWWPPARHRPPTP